MGNVLVINSTSFETRVALVEDGTISEYYAERKREKGIVGNIYKGRVLRVLPGMQAAFVDLGTDKAGFLYVNDVWYDPSFNEEAYDLTEGEWGFGADDLPEEEAAQLEAVYERGPKALEEGRPRLSETEGVVSREQRRQVDADSRDEPSSGEGSPESAADEASRAGPSGSPEEAVEAGDGPPAEDESREGAESSAKGGAGESSDASEEGAKEAAPTQGAEASVEDAPEGAASADEGTSDSRDEETAEQEPAGACEEKSEAPVTAVPEPASDDAEAHGKDDEEKPASKGETEEEDVSREASASDDASGESDGPSENDEDEDREQRGRRGRRRINKRRGRTYQRSERVAEARKERAKRSAKRAEIQELLKEGDEIVVQIAKGPIGSKGARITTHVSLPGRHLVFMPTVDHVGISRRIASDKERRRLRQIIEEIRPPGTGFIVRTVADGVSREKLVADARFLLNLWADINKRKERISAPALLHPDLDLILRATRDLFGEEVERLVIDDEQEYRRLLDFMDVHMPALKDKAEHYKGKEPIFDGFGIEDELRRAQQRRVWLKSGGYLIIDQAEALTAIDVNSGRYIGKKNLEETITKINIEAAEEVVYQLRLRNMGGIIILDFIDMEKASNREKVYRALEEALRKDKAKTNILKISELGLVEMTRKRVRESLTRMMNEPCPYCDGRGMMKTSITVAYEVLRDAMREAAHRKEDTIFVNCSHEVAALLTTVERDALRYTMERARKKLVMKAQEGYHREQYDLYAKNTETGKSEVLGEGSQKEHRAAEPSGSRSSPAGRQTGDGTNGSNVSSSSGGRATGSSAKRRRRRRGRSRRESARGDKEKESGERRDGGSAEGSEGGGGGQARAAADTSPRSPGGSTKE